MRSREGGFISLISPHLVWHHFNRPHFIWTECNVTGRSRGELGRSCAFNHFALWGDPVCVTETDLSALSSDEKTLAKLNSANGRAIRSVEMRWNELRTDEWYEPSFRVPSSWHWCSVFVLFVQQSCQNRSVHEKIFHGPCSHSLIWNCLQFYYYRFYGSVHVRKTAFPFEFLYIYNIRQNITQLTVRGKISYTVDLCD